MSGRSAGLPPPGRGGPALPRGRVDRKIGSHSLQVNIDLNLNTVSCFMSPQNPIQSMIISSIWQSLNILCYINPGKNNGMESLVYFIIYYDCTFILWHWLTGWWARKTSMRRLGMRQCLPLQPGSRSILEPHRWGHRQVHRRAFSLVLSGTDTGRGDATDRTVQTENRKNIEKRHLCSQSLCKILCMWLIIVFNF